MCFCLPLMVGLTGDGCFCGEALSEGSLCREESWATNGNENTKNGKLFKTIFNKAKEKVIRIVPAIPKKVNSNFLAYSQVVACDIKSIQILDLYHSRFFISYLKGCIVGYYTDM